MKTRIQISVTIDVSAVSEDPEGRPEPTPKELIEFFKGKIFDFVTDKYPRLELEEEFSRNDVEIDVPEIDGQVVERPASSLRNKLVRQ